METLRTICMWTGVVWWVSAFIFAPIIVSAMRGRDELGEPRSFGFVERVEPWE